MAKKKSTKKKTPKKKTTKKKPPKEQPEDEQPPAAEEPQPLEDQPGEEISDIEKELDMGSSLESGLQAELLKTNNELTLQNDQLRAANEEIKKQFDQVVKAYRALEDKVITLTQQPAAGPGPAAPQPQGPPQQPAAQQPPAAPQPQGPPQQPATPPESAEQRFARIEEILIQNNEAIELIIGRLQSGGLYTPTGSQQVQPGQEGIPIPLGGQGIPGQPGQPGTLKDAAGRLALKWLEPENKEKRLIDALYTRTIKDLTDPAPDPFGEIGREALSVLLKKGFGGVGGGTAQDIYGITFAKERAKEDAKKLSKYLPKHED